MPSRRFRRETVPILRSPAPGQNATSIRSLLRAVAIADRQAIQDPGRPRASLDTILHPITQEAVGVRPRSLGLGKPPPPIRSPGCGVVTQRTTT